MAEFAEKNIQATVAEVEEIERLGLLLKKEVTALIEKRREWEYRLSRRCKNKDDFIGYVNYEKKLLELLKIRRKQMRIYEKYKEIEGAIQTRIMKRCRYTTRYWPAHQDTWALRISFACEIGWKAEASIAYAEQIRYQGNLESIYISWARFEVEERDNFDMARRILLSKAPLYHAKSLHIRREHFRLELLYVEYLNKRVEEDKAITEVIEENREKVLKCDVARAVYQDAVREIADPQLYLDLYQVAEKFPFAHDLQEEIYKDLVIAFPKDVSVWKLRAHRVVLGIESFVIEGEEVEASKKLLAKDKLETTIAVYDEALNTIGPVFFNTYIDELMAMLYECWSNTQLMKIIAEKLLQLFNSFEKDLLPVHYIIWFHILSRKPGCSEKAADVLKTAVRVYPDAPPFQLELLKQMLEGDAEYKHKMRRFKPVGEKAKGAYGVEVWELIVSKIKDRKLKIAEYVKACNHMDDTISKRMRIRYLEWINKHRPIKRSRVMYDAYWARPPFSNKLHATLVKGEMKKRFGDMKSARMAFENAVLQSGKTQPGLWLTYIYFEKYAGEPLNSLALYTRAEQELEAEHAEEFRQLHSMASERIRMTKELQKGKSAKQGSPEEEPTGKANEVWVTAKETKEERTEQKPATVRLFDEELMLSYSVDQERNDLFSSISDMTKFWETGCQPDVKDDGSEWEEVLEIMTGEKIPLTIRRVKVENVSQSGEKKPRNSALASKKEKKYELSDHLDPGSEKRVTNGGTGDLEKILDSSLTLKPEFMKQTQLSPYIMGKAKAKAIRQKERVKTKGPGWFDMKAPELTEEMKRDIEILQMRPVLDPKRPFKNKDMQVVPKYFQMGKIIDSPVDFYSSRIPKKKRKRTMAEEILHDEDALRYQKRKYNEIIAKKQKRHSKKRSDGERKSSR